MAQLPTGVENGDSVLTLRSVVLHNFRGYTEEARIHVEDLTAFVGRNDSGKSSVLDALAIFFGSPLCKLEAEDSSIEADEDDRLIIGCEFENVPDRVVIDDASETSLGDEFLLTPEGTLEVYKSWKIGAKSTNKPSVSIRALHPSAPDVDDLLSQKNQQLKALADQVDASVDDRRSNPSLRSAIRDAVGDLDLSLRLVQLDKEDGKKVWERIEQLLPTFALFRADRPSTDADAEVQDPLRVAIDMAISELADELESIKESVKSRAVDVATRTVEQLRLLNPELAETLNPDFSKEPGWAGLFKIGLSDDAGVPLNKRGSGVRRLVLLSFLRAEAERQRESSEGSGIIYAIEEPETAQHPSNQRLIVRALQDLAAAEDTQVLITTHVPALAAELPTRTIRHVVRDDSGVPRVPDASEAVLEAVVDDLGVLGEKLRAKALVCVEGPSDVVVLESLANVLRRAGTTTVDLRNVENVAIVPLGGSTLIDWATQHYLKSFSVPEVHIYDRDVPPPDEPRYQTAVDEVNGRDDGSIAFITKKREIENYLHPVAVHATFERTSVGPVSVEIDDWCDVESTVKESLGGQGRVDRRPIKKWLADAASEMTYDLLAERDALDEVHEWMAAIEVRVNEA